MISHKTRTFSNNYVTAQHFGVLRVEVTDVSEVLDDGGSKRL
jgi:hypothetical protein